MIIMVAASRPGAGAVAESLYLVCKLGVERAK